ncbi:hypothetical protein HYFRA_00007293 [Hymenoscyphus fraxineus]|uniref:F-box domain-containing protein n=1 Tax=Hymenoscyphus fraxineus TaxID=746836 RepID=A0A9N9PLP5_9HELO|nr:hypothetical protein HYFRA_00007293 [Hymenoscyphus fraxineus]
MGASSALKDYWAFLARPACAKTNFHSTTESDFRNHRLTHYFPNRLKKVTTSPVMSPQVFSCIICGVPIHDYDASTSGSWSDQFRVIYRNPSGCFISGVGCREDNRETTWDAPSDPDLRWDDERSHGSLIDVQVMKQPVDDDQHGFVLHEACWKLLETAFPSILAEIPLKRLIDIFESLPFPVSSKSAYWGHDYGKLIMDIEEQGLYPWEEFYLADTYQPEAGDYVNANPYDVPDLPASLSMRTEYPPELSVSSQPENKNLFSKLPVELLENIALNLPTESALSLRLVSKVFFPLLYNQAFWASRFEANGDRDFVFETWGRRNSADDMIDWLSLYRLTSFTHCSPGLKNRRRIWSLVQPLIETIDLSPAETLDTVSEDHDHTSLEWTKVDGALTTRYPFKNGCRLFDTRVGRVCKDLSKIAFSLSTVGTICYISGIRLISRSGSNVCLGLISKTNEIILEVTTLRGFILAMGSMGLHALQVIQEDSRVSKWVGFPGNAPLTERLIGFRCIDFLQVGCDGFKIVSFGISPSAQTTEGEAPSLHKTALWYPTIPPPILSLNEPSYTAGINLSAEYNPLFWTHFGGPGGCKLKHLTSVSFDVAQGFFGLKFHYGAGPGHETCKLGRYVHSDSSEEEHFLIDGPGGEVIESVEVILEHLQVNIFDFLRDGKLNAVKLTTNRNRSFQGGFLWGHGGTTVTLPLTITPGTTLTGFYASKHIQFGLISIGAISEVLDK